MIDMFVTLRVLPGRAAEFEAMHRRLLARMCEMPGCLDMAAYRSMSEPLEYIVHGRWESKETWDRAHQTSTEFRTLFAQLPLKDRSLSRASFYEAAYTLAGRPV